MRHHRASVLLTVPLLLAGCGGDDGAEADPPPADAEEPGDAEEADGDGSGAGAEVAILDEDGRRFEPADVAVAAGGTVTWTHDGGLPHTVTAEDGTFDSGDLSGGDTFSWTAEEAGTVSYVCSIHPEMTGTIEVS